MKDFKQDLFNYLVANNKFEEFYGSKKEKEKKEQDDKQKIKKQEKDKKRY